jgi:hypothetical protein
MGSSSNLEVDDQTNVKKILAISLSNTQLSKFETFGRQRLVNFVPVILLQ